MHLESIEYMREAFIRHASVLEPGQVLDLGATGKRKWYRETWEQGGWRYVGADLTEGPNVDAVLADPFVLPFADGEFDAVISGQMLEHNEFFWLSFIEMSRVLKPGGLMIHIAPSRGIEHKDPQDCWRFYRDGMAALAKWAGLELVEATTDWAPEHYAYARENCRHRLPGLRASMRRRGTDWGDTIGVFRKRLATWDSPAAAYVRYFAEDLARQAQVLRFAAE